jgi:hypothetical protein
MGTEARAVLESVDAELSLFPADSFVSIENKGRDGYQRADQTLLQEHADAQYQLAVKLGSVMTATASRRTKLFGACATDTNTANDLDCVDAFISKRGSWFLRRPLTPDDVAFYRRALRGASTVSPGAWADVVTLLFAAPEVFFVVEPMSADAATAELPSYALATRLSLQLLDEPADDALWQAAGSGQLSTTAGYQQAVDRLLSDPRSNETMRTFFASWYQLQNLPNLADALTQPKYQSVVGTQALPSGSEGMVEDLLGSVDNLLKRNGAPRELLVDRAVYTRDSKTAALYGAPPWDGVSTPQAPPSSKRAGLLTRVAMLTFGDPSTHPILRGVRIRTNLLCDRLQSPPDVAEAVAATPLTGKESERERTIALTGQGGCAGCHSIAINPLGFAHEGFDPLGRERTVENVFDASGQLVAQHAIDTTVTPHVDFADTRPVADAVEVTERIAASGKFESCLVSQYFRFAFSRTRDTPEDGCLLSRMENLARGGASMKSLVREFVSSMEFKRRVVRN